MTDQRSFDGTLIEVPFGPDTVRKTAVEQYRALLADSESEDVLVLTGSPTSMATFREVLGDEPPGAVVPRVTSVVVHATNVINRTDDRAILSDAIRRELVHRFITEWEWETEYFARAAGQKSFTRDIAQLVETAAWQNTVFDVTPELQEIGRIRDEFHAWLAEHGQLERGQMVTEATDILASGDQSASVRDFDAVLVIEFEEFGEQDRRYLQQLAADREVVCIAETDASLRRTHIETRAITDRVSFRNRRRVEHTAPTTRPAATAQYFARGTIPEDPERGRIEIIAAETTDDELDRIADEIEQLCEKGDVMYEDVAVALNGNGQSVIDAMRTLREAGIPTSSATVVGFGDDPAIREVLGAVEAIAGTDRNQSNLIAGEPLLPHRLQASMETTSHLGNALRLWATESDLKRRLAAESTPLDARSQFGNLRRAFAIADFVEETEFFESTWGSLVDVLRRAHEYAPQDNQTSAIDHDGGVRIDSVQTLKNGAFDVVFVVDVTDETFPGDPIVSRVFPRERVTSMPDYPGVTDVDEADVKATFPTSSSMSSHPFRQYHAEHARRQLAIGASIADERVYFCLHSHEGTALDERVQPSRYLTDAYRTLPWMTEAADTAITTERAAEDYLLSRIDRALAEIRRATSRDVDVSLDEIEAEFAEIQALLDASGDRGEQLREALQARRDFAAGRVRRE